MRYDVAVIGGGPSGAVAAAELARGGVSTVLLERNFDNVKPCGGAIPLGLIRVQHTFRPCGKKAFTNESSLSERQNY